MRCGIFLYIYLYIKYDLLYNYIIFSDDYVMYLGKNISFRNLNVYIYRKLPLSHAPLAHNFGLLTVDAWIPENFFKYYVLSMSRSRSRISKFFKGRGLGIMSIAIYTFYVSGRYYSFVFM